MERRMFGQWERFTDEPETETGKADYVSAAVDKLLHRFVGHGFIPDWGTIQIIIKEGCDIFSGPDWYENEKEDYKGPYVGWAMTVGIKFYSENYPELYDERMRKITKENRELIKGIVNDIQWVQEYVQAVGEEHKQVYVDALENAMKQLMTVVKE